MAGLGLLALSIDRMDQFVPDVRHRMEQMRRALAPVTASAVAGELRELAELMSRVERGPAIREVSSLLNRTLTWLGGESMDETCYPHEQPWRDLCAVEQACDALRRHDLAGARAALGKVTGMSWGQHVGYETYRYHLFTHVEQPERDWLWANGRVSPYLDVWHAWHLPDPARLESLRRSALENLKAALQVERRALQEAMALPSQ